ASHARAAAGPFCTANKQSMIILHAGADNGRLWLWAEAPAEEPTPRRKPKDDPSPAASPYDAGPLRLAGAFIEALPAKPVPADRLQVRRLFPGHDLDLVVEQLDLAPPRPLGDASLVTTPVTAGSGRACEPAACAAGGSPRCRIRCSSICPIRRLPSR